MTSIYDLPFEDIQKFLDANGISYEDEKDAYDKTLKLLKNKNAIGHTMHIIEWMIAHNLLFNKVNIPSFTIYRIDNMRQLEIDEWAKILTMKGNNRENIKNILRYMGKLDTLIEHPDIKPKILDTILELKVLTSSLEDVIKMFKDNKFLRKFIYDNMDKIINNNVKEIMYVHKITPEELSRKIEQSLVDFIINLLKLNEITLAKQAIQMIGKYPIKQQIVNYLIYQILTSLDVDLISKFFNILDNVNRISKYKNSEYLIVYTLTHPYNDLKTKQRKFLPSIFEAALIKEKIEVLKVIYHFWWFESAEGVRNRKYNVEFLREIEPLIKEFEEKYPYLKYED
jgi:hypothetical protein